MNTEELPPIRPTLGRIKPIVLAIRSGAHVTITQHLAQKLQEAIEPILTEHGVLSIEVVPYYKRNG